jgi:phage FluMu gp28-like protein
MKTDLSKVDILLPYQKAWIEDESRLKIWEKSRRIGASWTEALNSVLHTQGSKGQSTYYLSYNKDMTRQFVTDCKFWAEIVNIAAGDLEEEIVKDNDKSFTVYRIRFLNGKEIVGLPSVAHTIRSNQGRIILDEAAFTDDFDGIKKAALALLIWGGSFSIISTHNGDDSPFCAFLKDIREGKEKKWSAHRTTFNEAVKQGLYKHICIKTGRKWTKKEEAVWVAEIRNIYRDNVEEELDVIPSRSGSKYFPYGMLSACAVGADKLPIVRFTCDDEFMWKEPEERLKKSAKWFNAEAATILRNIKGPCCLGYDFARSGNLSVIWISEEDGKGGIKSRLIIELCRMQASLNLC